MDFKGYTHVLMHEQYMHPQKLTCWHEQNRSQCSIRHTILSGTPSEDFTIHGYLSCIPLWVSVVCVFGSFYWWPKARLCKLSTSAWLQWTNWRMKLCLATKRHARKWYIMHRKVNKELQLANLFKCKSGLAVAQPQENAWCWQHSLSLSQNTHMHWHEYKQLIFFF